MRRKWRNSASNTCSDWQQSADSQTSKTNAACKARLTCKPHSVPLAGRRSSICPASCLAGSSDLPGAACGAGHPSAPEWSCSRWGLPGRRHHCRRRWSLAPPFHPHPRKGAIRSLLHLPSRFRAWPLASTAPCGVRTFLRPEDRRPSGQPGKRIIPAPALRMECYTASLIMSASLGNRQKSMKAVASATSRKAPS